MKQISEQSEAQSQKYMPTPSITVDSVIQKYDTITRTLLHLLETVTPSELEAPVDQWKGIQHQTETWEKISTSLKEIENLFDQIKDDPVFFEHINTSLRSLDTKEHSDSLRLFTEKLKSNPHDFISLLNVAILHLKLGNVMDFANALGNITTFATGEYNYWLGLRYEYGPEPDTVQAREHYLTAVTLCPTHSAAFTNLATILYYKFPIDDRERQQVVNKVISILQQAIATDYTATNYLAHYHLAYIYDIERNDISQAIYYYFRALDINPKHVPSLTHCGSLLLEKADKEEDETEKSELQNTALKFYRRALELSPNDLILYYKTATALAANGSVDDAIACMERAIEIDPRQPYTYYTLGNILYNAKYLEDAITFYKKAIQVYNENVNNQSLLSSLQFPDTFDISVCINTLVGLLRRQARILYSSKNRNYESLEKATNCLYEAIQLCAKIDDSEMRVKEDKIGDKTLSDLTFQLRLELAGCLMLCSKPHEAAVELATALLIGPKEFIDLYKDIERAFFQDELPILVTMNSSSSSSSSSSLLKSTSPYYSSDRHKYFEVITKLQTQRDLPKEEVAIFHYDAAIIAFQMNLLDTTLRHLTKAIELNPSCISHLSYTPSTPKQEEKNVENNQ